MNNITEYCDILMMNNMDEEKEHNEQDSRARR